MFGALLLAKIPETWMERMKLAIRYCLWTKYLLMSTGSKLCCILMLSTIVRMVGSCTYQSLQPSRAMVVSHWTSEKPNDLFTYKRGIIVQLQHANPYYDDSYAVKSANIGPYGDAITYEFLPFIDKKFRCIGEGWAHDMYGGSTCGWESLAVQVYYPEEYSGCWSFCPDAFDFRRFQQVNLLQNKNAY
ncbi:hypothetical protein PsorP6_019633 [Peronosclerospora sorghi]|nr:hypothetical protein PsorP6_019633 [Peronosclerospora sorghi]